MIETHATGHTMARTLVQYIEDPVKVREIVRGEFKNAPDIFEIKAMRAKRERAITQPIRHLMLNKNADHEAIAAATRALLKALYLSHPYVFDAAERAGRRVARP